MNVKPVLNNLNFGKTLIRKTDVKKFDNSIEKACFVEYDPDNQEDREQILSQGVRWAGRYKEKAWAGSDIVYWFFAQTPSWFKKRVCPEPAYEFKSIDEYRFFGLENKEGDILALGAISEKQHSAELAFIQTDPKEMHGSKTRSFKCLGQTLVSELIKLIRKNPECRYIELSSSNDSFWDNSGFFEHEEGESDYFLSSKKFSKYIKLTKDKINS